MIAMIIMDLWATERIDEAYFRGRGKIVKVGKAA